MKGSMNRALNSTSDAVIALLRQLGVRANKARAVTITFSAHKPVKVEAEMFGDSDDVEALRTALEGYVVVKQEELERLTAQAKERTLAGGLSVLLRLRSAMNAPTLMHDELVEHASQAWRDANRFRWLASEVAARRVEVGFGKLRRCLAHGGSIAFFPHWPAAEGEAAVHMFGDEIDKAMGEGAKR